MLTLFGREHMNNEWHLEIDIAELEAAFRAVVKHLSEFNGTSVKVREDYFWSVPPNQIFDVPTQPELTIGQLSESWDNLKRERQSNDESTIGYAAVWLADVLKAIGYTHP